MCGITGAVWMDQQMAVDEPALRRMTDCLVHRGPDDRGLYRAEMRVEPPYPDTPRVVGRPGSGTATKRTTLPDCHGVSWNHS